MNDKLKKIGPLNAVEIKAQGRGPAIVLFHGFGADCFDLTPLSQVLKAPKNSSWYFPNGPLDVPIGPMNSGRAWFNIDMNALEEAMRMGRYRDMTRQNPQGLDKVKKQAYEFIQALGVPTEDIIIGGFSQGAMLATELALSSTSQYRGLVILSGTLLKRDEWEKLAPLHKGLRFFQVHGENDALLDPAAAKQLEQVLIKGGLEGELNYFRGGHEIPNQVLRDLSSFLQSLT